MPPDQRNASGVRPQDLALTIAGVHLREPGQRVWSGGFVTLLREFGFSTEASRAALTRLVQRALLDREMDGRRALYTLTGKAVELLERGDERIFSFGRTAPATDIWTVLWHAIPETRRVERSRFASRLRFLGFGSVQDATWVAAHDREIEVLELAVRLNIRQYISIVVGRMSERAQPEILVAEAWDLSAVDERYRQFLADYGDLRRPAARRALSPREAFLTRTLMLHRFRAFPFLDPELPLGETPQLRARAIELLDVLSGGLADAAGEHFREVAQPEFARRVSAA
jgi:phenylacetic acid degradation operon negative regulatory protein